MTHLDFLGVSEAAQGIAHLVHHVKRRPRERLVNHHDLAFQEGLRLVKGQDVRGRFGHGNAKVGCAFVRHMEVNLRLVQLWGCVLSPSEGCNLLNMNIVNGLDLYLRNILFTLS